MHDSQHISDQQMELQQIALDELESGECLLWSDRPDAWRAVPSGFLASIFAIFWTALFVCWMVDDYIDGHLEFILFKIPFVLIGLALLGSPYWSYLKARRTVYGITNRRVFIIDRGRIRTVESYTSRDMGEISRKERNDGSGDLVFAQIETIDNYGPTTRIAKFTGIKQVRFVENLLRETLVNQKSSIL